jgi:hypothetical protein
VSAAISSVHTLEADEDAPPATLKTKKLTKSVKHIMELLDKEAVEAANKVKVIPNIKPGNVVQLKVVSFCLLLCLSFLSYILFDIL